MASVFIKVPVSERLPKESGGIIGYCDTADILQQFYFDSKKGIFHDPLDDEATPMRVTIWLEEVELPKGEVINNLSDSYITDVAKKAYKRGANFILDKLKGGNNG